MVKSERTTGANDQREQGRQQVIDTIRQAGQIARIDIAQATGSSPATVTAITSELLAEGLIEEIAPEGDRVAAKRGRPRVALKIRGEAHLMAGVKVSDRVASVALVDFEGNGVGEYSAKMPRTQLVAAELVDFIQSIIADACDSAGINVEKVSGVGLGLAGLVDGPKGLVHWSPSLTERNVNLGALLAEKSSVPYFMDNDANLVAKAEQLFGEGRNVSDFIVITVEHGVGMGIVIDHKIYRGTRGCGAEFGHTKVHLDGALCRCGQRGCLEAYVADYALLKEANIRDTGDQSERNLESLFTRAKAGDQTAQSIFNRAGRMFAMGLANVVNIFDPKLIILSGERMLFDYFYADAVLDSMKASVVQIDAPLPEVKIHKWGDLMWAKGAAAYAMEGVTERAIRRLSANAE